MRATGFPLLTSAGCFRAGQSHFRHRRLLARREAIRDETLAAAREMGT